MALNWFNFDSMRPSQILDQHFGLDLNPDDLFTPLSIPYWRSLSPFFNTTNYFRPWRVQHNDQGSTVKIDKDQFQINLDVQQFSPEEVTVKVVDNSIVIEGKHEEKKDEHGYISRQFQRRYVLPDGHDIQKVASNLSTDGVLTISVPKLASIESNEKIIPITHTGEPHKAIKSSDSKSKL